MSAEPLRVVLVDDHALCRSGLTDLLHHRGNIRVVAALGDPEKVAPALQEHKPDLVVLDLRMPSTDGLTLLRRLRAEGCDTPALILTMSDSEVDLAAALRAGVLGYLLKDMNPEDLVPALEAARHGDNVVAKEMVGSLTRLVQGQTGETPLRSAAPLSDLTPREMEILSHVAEGQSNKMIARALNITDGTVKLHVKAILRKLGVHSRVEAAVIAVEQGLGRKKNQKNDG